MFPHQISEVKRRDIVNVRTVRATVTTSFCSSFIDHRTLSQSNAVVFKATATPAQGGTALQNPV